MKYSDLCKQHTAYGKGEMLLDSPGVSPSGNNGGPPLDDPMIRGWAAAAGYCATPVTSFIDKVKREKAPPPFRAGRVVAWRRSWLDEYIESNRSTVSARQRDKL